MSGTIFGIDSDYESAENTLTNSAGNSYLGRIPTFWGRYFCAPGQKDHNGNPTSNYSVGENSFLRSHNIRVAPLARQTRRVNGSSNDGAADAEANMDALLEAFPAQYLAGADPNVLIFLDVEGDPEKDQPCLSQEYYTGWSTTLVSYGLYQSRGTVNFRPAIYGHQADDTTWTALNNALNSAQGVTCYGAWIARWYKDPSSLPTAFIEPHVTPNVALICPILAWQYWASPVGAPRDFDFDLSMVNPAHVDMLQAGIVLPPP